MSAEPEGSAPAQVQESGLERAKRLFRKYAPKRRTSLRLVLELIVVFAGVTLAFALENWREQRNRQQSAHLVQAALLDEIALPAAIMGPAINAEIRDTIAEWQARYQRGERPIPVHYKTPRASRAPSGVWDAAVASGLVNLIDPRLLFCLSEYYNRLDSLGDSYDRYTAFNETEILPYLNDPDRFYNAEGRLKRPFAAHIERLQAWHDEHEQFIADAREIRLLLSGEAEGSDCLRKTAVADRTNGHRY